MASRFEPLNFDFIIERDRHQDRIEQMVAILASPDYAQI